MQMQKPRVLVNVKPEPFYLAHLAVKISSKLSWSDGKTASLHLVIASASVGPPRKWIALYICMTKGGRGPL